MPNSGPAGASELLNDLAAIYERQHDVYRQLLETTKKQLDTLDGDDWQEINNILAQKQAFISRITALDREASDLKRRLQEVLRLEQVSVGAISRALEEEGITGCQRVADRLRTVIDRLTALVSQIQGLETKAEKLLRSSMQGAGKELTRIKKAKSARSAYQRRVVDARFIDKRR